MISSTPTDPNKRYDALIFGGGLAGSILFDQMRRAGKRCLLIDDPSCSRCSRVAAGLINPIGGKRLNLVWAAAEAIPYAKTYYAQLAEERSQTFFHPRALARLFVDQQEARQWQSRQADPAYQRWTRPLPHDLLPPSLRPARGGFLVPEAGYLDTVALLQALQTSAADSGQLVRDSFRYCEIESGADGVVFRGIQADFGIFAEGHLARRNPWFAFVPYRPAKGVLGLVRSDAPLPENTAILKGKFLIPRHDGLIGIGATYNWDDTDETPDAEGIGELEAFLNEHLGDQWSWETVTAGVRPSTAGAYPAIGPHPEHGRLVAFNGFGSKGSLQIPYLAQRLIERLWGGQPLPPEADVARFYKRRKPETKRWRATAVAREHCLPHLRPGDVAIDATMGNGHDTLWLCEAVGASGHVFAFDVQPQALVSARDRLEAHGLLDRATLLLHPHQFMAEAIPARYHGIVSAVIFNLGYLPRGDPTLITRPDTTLVALNAALELLKPGGILAATLYPAHPGGREEAEQALAWLRAQGPHAFVTEIATHPTGNPSSPFPIFVVKRDSPTG